MPDDRRRLISMSARQLEGKRTLVGVTKQATQGRSTLAPGHGGAIPGHGGTPPGLQAITAFAALAGSRAFGAPPSSGSIAAYAAAVAADSPKGFWQMQEASGDAADSSGNSFTLTAPTPTPTYHAIGPFGSFAITTGGGKYFQHTQISTVTANFTLELWLNVGINSGAQCPIYNGVFTSNGWGVELTAVNGNTQYKVHFLAGNVLAGPDSTTVCSNGTWYHIVVLRGASAWQYWINGVQDATSPGTTTPNAPSAGTTAVGNFHGLGLQASYAFGALYETALSGARISAHYHALAG